MSDMQLVLPGVVAEGQSEWVWVEAQDSEANMGGFEHTTVMRDEVVEALAPRPGGLYVDATVGGGGHSEAILLAEPECRVIAIDRDITALEASRQRLASFGARVTFVHGPFAALEGQLVELGVSSVDGICADLGVSSPQLDDPSRGMSFRRDGPIDMRMDAGEGYTALELISEWSDEQLADIIFRYGEERRSRRIARSIHRAFADGELHTTMDLRRAVVRAVGPARIGGVDPATRTFQALRIAVNDELGQLEGLLAKSVEALKDQGTLAIISFHSLEDRLVKRAFASEGWQALWKKPRSASDSEAGENPRARSAKLRAAQKVSEPQV